MNLILITVGDPYICLYISNSAFPVLESLEYGYSFLLWISIRGAFLIGTLVQSVGSLFFKSKGSNSFTSGFKLISRLMK